MHNTLRQLSVRLLALYFVLALLPRTATAQEFLMLENPYAPEVTGGSIHAAALQADGKLLIGGNFTHVDGTPRPGLARLHPDGTLDTGFAGAITIFGAPLADSTIHSIAPLPDGRILIGGDFLEISRSEPGGPPSLHSRQGIARLDADGTLDTSFTPPTITPRVILTLRNRVRAVLPLASGKILVAGWFTNVGDSSPARTRIARLNDDGTLDTAFQAVDIDGDVVRVLLEQSDGKVVIGGRFTNVGGLTRRHLARLGVAGTVDGSFNIGVQESGGEVHAILQQQDGKLVVGGTFDVAHSNGGASRVVANVARFNAVQQVENGFPVFTNGTVRWLQPQVDGKFLIGGDFTSIAATSGGWPNPRSKLARLLRDGELEMGYYLIEADGPVRSGVQQDDGRVIVIGGFSQVNSTARSGLARVVHVRRLTQVQQISAGIDHTCAVQNGAAKCWGRNQGGQLGDGSLIGRHAPGPVFGLGSGVQAISASRVHTCAVQNGAAKCWGANDSGSLGNGAWEPSYVPVQVTGLDAGVQMIGGGYFHSCALHNGAVKCWGDNRNGQLGIGTTEWSNTPVQVNGLESDVTAISVGENHACALKSVGAVVCWGANDKGQLGDGSTLDRLLPVAVSGLSHGVQAISAGVKHTCARTTAGTVKCWGDNASGRLGDGTTDDRLVPTEIPGFANVAEVSAGGAHTCARQQGAAKCWGNNAAGQLGIGMLGFQPSPTQVVGLSSGVHAVSTGGYHSCAVAGATHAAMCWGFNMYGQVGDTSQLSSNSPQPVLELVAAPTLDIFVDGFELP